MDFVGFQSFKKIGSKVHEKGKIRAGQVYVENKS